MSMISHHARDSLAAASIYFVCLIVSLYLARGLWPRPLSHKSASGDHRRRRTFWMTAGIAFGAGMLLTIPSLHRVVPDSWIGRGVYQYLRPQYVTEPGFAKPATREDRLAALADLKDAIAARVDSQRGVPKSRETIDWVPIAQWQVPGSPGLTYSYAPLDDLVGFAFELREPFRIDGEQLVVRGEVAR